MQRLSCEDVLCYVIEEHIEMMKEMMEASSFSDFVKVHPLCDLKELNAIDDLHVYADADAEDDS
jgi:hypothetical protein